MTTIRRKRKYLELLSGPAVSARLLRVLLPMVILAIFIQGLLDETISRILNINEVLFTALLSLTVAIIMAIVIVQLSRIIFRKAEKAEIKRKRMEEKNQQLASIIESSDDAIIGKTLDGIITSWNNGAEKMYGYTKEQAINQPISMIIPADHQDEMAQILEKIQSGQHIDHYETVRQRKDGTQINISVSISPIYNSGGTLIGASTIGRDITERKHAEEILHASEENFRAIFENSSSAIAIIEPDTTISMVNDAYCQMSGYTRQEVIGMSWTQQIPPEDLERLKEYNRRRLINPQDAPDEYEFKFYKKGGEIRYGLMSISLMQRSRKIITSFIDITERKLTEELIATQKRRLSDIIEGTHVGTWEWNIQTGEMTYNERWAEIIGYTLKGLGPISIDTWQKFVHPDDAKISNDLLQKHFRKELEYYECEIRLRHKSGDWVWVLDSGKVVTWTQDGRPLLMSGTHQDITQRKQAEAEREKLINELKAALADVKTLSGLLPICASCKKIRDDNGYWLQVEGYISKHSEARFTHGICPDCMTKYYPEYAVNRQKGLEK